MKKFEQNQDSVFELRILKAVIAEIEGNDDMDGEHLYHGQKLKYYRRAKQYIADHCCFLVESIIQSYEGRYWFDADNESADGTTNNHLIFHICKVLNSITWPLLPNDNKYDEDILKVQIKSISKVYEQFSGMDIFKDVQQEDIMNGYIGMVRYCQRYFDFGNIHQVELWHKLLLLCKDKIEWYSTSLIIEICLCTPCSNATLDRFFSQLQLVKTDLRTTLSSSSLNAVLRIKLRGTSITAFNEKYSDKVVSYWYNQKQEFIKKSENSTRSEHLQKNLVSHLIKTNSQWK